MKIEVSIGEAVDKLSILELKLQKIKDENKKVEVQKEIELLSEFLHYKKEFHYKLLLFINEQIWKFTDTIKIMPLNDINFPIISNDIFEYNQIRYRIKSWFNNIFESTIKEQKGYSLKSCCVDIDSEVSFFNNIHKIIYLSVIYDELIFEEQFSYLIDKLHLTNIRYLKETPSIFLSIY